MHSNYPQEPGYIRGIEVGLMGIAAGLVMLRWGIVATLIWHYTVDASLVGMLLIRSDNLYFKISGLIVGLAATVPLAYSGVSYLRRGHFENVEDLLNRAEPAPAITLTREVTTEEAAISARRYEPLTMGTLGFLAACVVVGGLLAWRLNREHIGDYLKLSVNRVSATQRADAVMREKGRDPNRYIKAAQMVDTTNPVTNEFLRRRMSVANINEIYAKQVPGALWRVRYFQDSQPEEFAVTLRPDGTEQGFSHTLAEATPGANLTKEEAVAIAEKYLEEKKHVNLSEWKLVESNSDKRPKRTDHTLVWQKNAPLDPQGSANNPSDHAYERMSVQVLGDEPADYRTFIKIPEEFARKQGEQSVGRILVAAGQICLVLGLIVSVLVYFFKRLRVQPAVRVPWRRFFAWGLVGLVGFAVSFLFGKGIPALLSNYPTAMPMRIFLATTIVGLLLAGAVLVGVISLLFGLAWSFAARAFAETQLPSWLGMPGEYYRDAFWIGLGGTAALIGLRHLLEYASAWWPTLHRGLPSSFGDVYDAVYPGAGLIGGAAFRALIFTGVLLLAGAFLGAELRARWLRLFLFFAVAAALVTGWGSPADFVKQFVASAILLLVVVSGMRSVIRFNMLGLFLIIACTLLLAGASELVSQPDQFYRVNGYAVLFGIVLLLAWPLVMWRMSRQAVQATT